jgi:hypothetical protein
MSYRDDDLCLFTLSDAAAFREPTSLKGCTAICGKLSFTNEAPAQRIAVPKVPYERLSPLSPKRTQNSHRLTQSVTRSHITACMEYMSDSMSESFTRRS